MFKPLFDDINQSGTAGRPSLFSENRKRCMPATTAFRLSPPLTAFVNTHDGRFRGGTRPLTLLTMHSLGRHKSTAGLAILSGVVPA